LPLAPVQAFQGQGNVRGRERPCFPVSAHAGRRWLDLRASHEGCAVFLGDRWGCWLSAAGEIESRQSRWCICMGGAYRGFRPACLHPRLFSLTLSGSQGRASLRPCGVRGDVNRRSPARQPPLIPSAASARMPSPPAIFFDPFRVSKSGKPPALRCEGACQSRLAPRSHILECATALPRSRAGDLPATRLAT